MLISWCRRRASARVVFGGVDIRSLKSKLQVFLSKRGAIHSVADFRIIDLVRLIILVVQFWRFIVSGNTGPNTAIHNAVVVRPREFLASPRGTRHFSSTWDFGGHEAISSAGHTAAHGRVDAVHASRPPRFGPVKGLEECCVFWCCWATVLERRHFLAGLVHVRICICPILALGHF